MGYAKHIGRIGALAVTLGVGVAIATPGVAFAEPSASTGETSSTDSSTSSDSSVSSEKAPSSSIKTPSTISTDTTSTDRVTTVDDDEGDETTDDLPQDDDGDEDDDSEEPVDEEDEADEADVDGDSEEEPVDEKDEVDEADEADDEGDGTPPPADDDVPIDVDAPVDNDDPNLDTKGDASGDPIVVTLPDTMDDTDTLTFAADQSTPFNRDETPPDEPSFTVARFSLTPTEDDPVTTFSITAPVAAPEPQPTLVTVVATLVNAALNPLMSWGSEIPFFGPVLLAALSAVRNEFERILFPRTTNGVAQQTTSQLVDPTTQRVLVIGVDGTNLSRILADPENDNFLSLIEGSTNSAPSIVGHTTISNPSWTAILTGVWGERTGVINNVFTPWTYDKFPTVFNQLETLENPDQDIVTKAIADWNVINAIAGAGSDPVDTNVFIAQVEGDTDWLATDDLVGQETVDAISGVDGPTPNFLFSYFVGVDENGHLYGGASEQYAAAIRNVDDNLGEIMTAVDEWNAANPTEQWTIIVVTDHGHQPQKGFGHGFQSPDETATFVIASGPAFADGNINLDYEIVDTTPTVVSLFGGTPRADADGVPLTSLSGSDVDPGGLAELVQELQEQIAANQSPDIVTEIRLGVRTIFATIPYLVYTELGGIPIVSDALYVATNVPAQIVAFLTGVQGASIFPLLPPPSPSFPSEEPTTTIADCTGADAEACIAV